MFTFTPSTTLPVSLSELKSHLRYPLEREDEDADLLAKLMGGIEDVQDLTGRVLISSPATLTLEKWPCKDYVELPGGQTSSITALKYTDSAGTQTTVAITEYKLVRGYSLTSPTQVIDGRARLQLAYQKNWPTAELDAGEPIEVTYQTGWKDADSVPWKLKAAVLVSAEILYWRDPLRFTKDTSADRMDAMQRTV
jgi:uncharacterized phiE125 gp8 family phage protein